MSLSKLSTIYSALLAIVCLTSCDDGKIYDEDRTIEREGGSIKLTAVVHNKDSWPSGYILSVAGFNDSEYAQTAQSASPDKDGKIEVVLSGISNDIKQIEVCIINKLRKRIISFYQTDYTEQTDTIFIDAGEINANMYNCVQSELFNRTCIGCHGESTHIAAGLNLTQGNSYKSLVNVPADKSETQMPFVTPGDVENSFLHHVLNSEGLTLNWSMDHEGMITSYTYLQLLDDWISNGANQ